MAALCCHRSPKLVPTRRGVVSASSGRPALTRVHAHPQALAKTLDRVSLGSEASKQLL